MLSCLLVIIQSLACLSFPPKTNRKLVPHSPQEILVFATVLHGYLYVLSRIHLISPAKCREIPVFSSTSTCWSCCLIVVSDAPSSCCLLLSGLTEARNCYIYHTVHDEFEVLLPWAAGRVDDDVVRGVGVVLPHGSDEAKRCACPPELKRQLVAIIVERKAGVRFSGLAI